MITYQGIALKPEKLLKAKTGGLVTLKSYKTVWQYDHIHSDWQNVLEPPQAKTMPFER